MKTRSGAASLGPHAPASMLVPVVVPSNVPPSGGIGVASGQPPPPWIVVVVEVVVVMVDVVVVEVEVLVVVVDVTVVVIVVVVVEVVAVAAHGEMRLLAASTWDRTLVPRASRFERERHGCVQMPLLSSFAIAAAYLCSAALP